MGSVPKAWPGSTVVCLGGGPSLTAEDVDYCRGKARVIAVNDAYRLAPWADALYGCDVQWWKWHHGVREFSGEKWSLEQPNWGNWHDRWSDIQLLKNAGDHGLSLDPTEIATGSNSGYQAVNLAVLYGARRVVLLGYDMQTKGTQSHWFGHHPQRAGVVAPFAQFLESFKSLVKPLADLGVEIVNCTPGSRLRCFPMATLRDTLCEVAA